MKLGSMFSSKALVATVSSGWKKMSMRSWSTQSPRGLSCVDMLYIVCWRLFASCEYGSAFFEW